jgi:hypothetical protein
MGYEAVKEPPWICEPQLIIMMMLLQAAYHHESPVPPGQDAALPAEELKDEGHQARSGGKAVGYRATSVAFSLTRSLP